MTIPKPRASAEADIHIAATHAAEAFHRGLSTARPGPPAGRAVSPTTDGRWGAPRGHRRAGVPLAALPDDRPTCPVTVYAPTNGAHGERTYAPRPCGRDVARDNLCAQHAEDRDRLAARRSASP